MNRIEVVSAVIVQDYKVLSAKRLPGQTFSGLWHMPGGKLEPGEDLITAARRKLLEELGVTSSWLIPRSSPNPVLTTLEVKYEFGEYRVSFIQMELLQRLEGQTGLVEWMDGGTLDRTQDVWIPGDWHVAKLALYQADHA